MACMAIGAQGHHEVCTLLQAQQDAAAAEAAVSAEHSTSRLHPGQLQRLKARNEELMQRRVEAASAKVREQHDREARLAAMQERVGCNVFRFQYNVSRNGGVVINCGVVAHMVERSLCMREVQGSIPCSSTQAGWGRMPQKWQQLPFALLRTPAFVHVVFCFCPLFFAQHV